MKRMAVLGCTLFVVVACGGGGSDHGENMMQSGPQETETSPMRPAMTPTLSTLGAYETTTIDEIENDSTTVFHRWGIWGGILRDDAVTCTAIGCPPPGDTIFMAYMNHEIDGTISAMTRGTRSETSPMSGSAVWIGNIAAYEAEYVTAPDGKSITTYAPVEGNARLEVDFAAMTVDVGFTNFDNSRTDISWNGLVMRNGEFGSGSIEGAFYSADHVGVAGTFTRDGLTGVFGALRSSE